MTTQNQDTKKITVSTLNGHRDAQAIEMKHDKGGGAEIYFSAPRFGLMQKQDAYALALALVELADSLPEES